VHHESTPPACDNPGMRAVEHAKRRARRQEQARGVARNLRRRAPRRQSRLQQNSKHLPHVLLSTPATEPAGVPDEPAVADAKLL
jgi:hypothetical protein